MLDLSLVPRDDFCNRLVEWQVKSRLQYRMRSRFHTVDRIEPEVVSKLVDAKAWPSSQGYMCLGGEEGAAETLACLHQLREAGFVEQCGTAWKAWRFTSVGESELEPAFRLHSPQAFIKAGADTPVKDRSILQLLLHARSTGWECRCSG